MGIRSMRGLLALASVLVVTAYGPPAAAQGSPYDVDQAPTTLRELQSRCTFARRCPVKSDDLRTLKDAVDGNQLAQYLVGSYLEFGRNFPDSGGARSAIGWFGRSAEQGNGEAALRYNDLRTRGLAATADETRIAEKLRPRAEAGSHIALLVLSEMHLYGRGVERNVAESMRLLRQAAAGGDMRARERLERRLMAGAPGLPADRAGLLELYRQAAVGGDPEAMERLGMELFDKGTAGDRAEGYRWLMRAAHVERPRALDRLIRLFDEGLMRDGKIIVAPDRVQAYFWLTIATRKSNEGLRPGWRAQLESSMSAADMDEARRRAAAWRPMSPAQAAAATFELPQVVVDADVERRAIIASLRGDARKYFDLPPGVTSQPWQRVPDFNRHADVMASIEAIAAYCQSDRDSMCVSSCRVGLNMDPREDSPWGGRDRRIRAWKDCASSIGMMPRIFR